MKITSRPLDPALNTSIRMPVDGTFFTIRHQRWQGRRGRGIRSSQVVFSWAVLSWSWSGLLASPSLRTGQVRLAGAAQNIPIKARFLAFSSSSLWSRSEGSACSSAERCLRIVVLLGPLGRPPWFMAVSEGFTHHAPVSFLSHTNTARRWVMSCPFQQRGMTKGALFPREAVSLYLQDDSHFRSAMTRCVCAVTSLLRAAVVHTPQSSEPAQRKHGLTSYFVRCHHKYVTVLRKWPTLAAG